MKKSVYILPFFLVFIFGLTVEKHESINATNPEEGFVPDQITAIAVAKAIWSPMFGEEIKKCTSFKAVLKDNKIWMVYGYYPYQGEAQGGYPYAEIRKSDSKIINAYHTK